MLARVLCWRGFCVGAVCMLINDVGPAEKMIARGGSMPPLSST